MGRRRGVEGERRPPGLHHSRHGSHRDVAGVWVQVLARRAGHRLRDAASSTGEAARPWTVSHEGRVSRVGVVMALAAVWVSLIVPPAQYRREKDHWLIARNWV